MVLYPISERKCNRAVGRLALAPEYMYSQERRQLALAPSRNP